MMRCPAIVGGHMCCLALMLCTPVALLGSTPAVPSSFVAAAAAQRGTSGAVKLEIGDYVRIILMDGREVIGKVAGADQRSLMIEMVFGSMTQEISIDRFNIDEIEKTDPPKATGSTGRDGQRDHDRDADRGTTAEDPGVTGGYILVPLEGEVGEELTAQFLGRVLLDAERAEAEAVILHIESPGGYVSSLERILELLDEPRDVRVVAYTDGDCFSAAAILAMSCDEFYVGPGAAVGAAVLWSGGEGTKPSAVDAKFAAAQAASWRARVEKLGRPGVLIDAMVLQDIEVWADTSTRPWTLFRERPRGERGDRAIRLDNEDRVLALTADQLRDTGGADGLVRSADALIERLELDRPDREAADGAAAFRRHASTVTRAMRDAERAIEEYDEIVEMFREGGEDVERMSRNDVRRAVRELRSKMKRLERLSKRYEHVSTFINEEAVRARIEWLDEVIEDLRG